MAPLLSVIQPANERVRNRSLQIGWDVLKSQLPSTPQELMIDLVSMREGVLPIDVGKAWNVLARNFKGPGGPKGTGLVPVPVGGPSLKPPASTPTIDPSAPLQITKQVAKTAKPLTPAQQGRRLNTKNRRRRQQPPLASLRQLSRDMMLPDEVLVAYDKDAKRGFRTQQAFASNWHETADAGHFFSTKADSGAHRYRPGKQGNAPTSGRSAAPEARTANRSGGAKAHHDLNPHIAREVGIPQTWADDFKLFVKEYYDLPHTNFNTHFSNKGRELLKAVPQNLSKSESMKVLKEILSDPSNIGENLSKQQMRDIRIDRARSNLNVDL